MTAGTICFDLGYSSRTVAGYDTDHRMAIVRMAEELGFDRLWHSNEKFGRDMVVNMALSATLTRRIGLGAALVDPYSVHPALTATAMATVHEFSGGRVRVAIGAGGSGFPTMGIERKRPVTAVREAIQVFRGMWRGDTVHLDGEVVRARGTRLHFKTDGRIPVYVATRGNAMFRMAGAVADGVMIATMATPEGVAPALALLRESIRRAGRREEEVEVISRVDCCVDRDRQKAREGVRQMIAFLLWSSYPNRDFVSQVGLEVPRELESLISRREYELMYEAGRLVPESFVDAFAWAGTPEEVAVKMGAIAKLGVRRFGCWVLTAPGGDLENVIRLIAEEVIPQVRSS